MMKKAAEIPVIGGLFDDSDEKMAAEIEGIKKLYEKLQSPDVEWDDFTPEELRVMSEYNPEEIQATLIQEDPRLLQEQRNYLGKLQGLSEQGLSDQDRLGMEVASRSAASDANARRQAALSNAQVRGVGGGGLEFALGEIGSQDAADRQSMEGMQQAAEAARQRALYTQAYGGELGNQRQANLNTESLNKNFINNFNAMNTQERNRAQLMNQQNKQNIYNQNVGLRNTANYGNQTNRLNANQQAFENELKRIGGLSGAMQGTANLYGAQGAQNKASREAAGRTIGSIFGGIYGGPMGAQAGGEAGASAGDLF